MSVRIGVLTVAWILATAACLALSVFWVRSYFVPELWAAEPLGTQGRSIAISSKRGRVLVDVRYVDDLGRGRSFRVVHMVDQSGFSVGFEAMASMVFGVTYWERWGFGYLKSTPPEHPLRLFDKSYFPRPVWMVLFPFWLPTVLFGALSLYTGIPVCRRLRRPRAGFCPTCGYDLRASADRCPECGAAVT
jgi:hypothetical protein